MSCKVWYWNLHNLQLHLLYNILYNFIFCIIFNIYIWPSTGLYQKCYQYADDTTVYKLCSVQRTLQSVSDLNSILNTLNTRSTTPNLTLNSGKKKSLLISTSQDFKLGLDQQLERNYHRFHWYATLENKTPVETLPIFASVLRVIDRTDRNPPITATTVTLRTSLWHASHCIQRQGYFSIPLASYWL